MIKCKECGRDCEETELFCAACGEILVTPEDECTECFLDFSEATE